MYVPPLHSSPGGATDVIISNSFPRSTWQEATSQERRPAIREITEVVVGIFCLLCLFRGRNIKLVMNMSGHQFTWGPVISFSKDTFKQIFCI